MPRRTRHLTVTELVARLRDGRLPPTPSWIEALSADPRRGVVAVRRALEAQRAARLRQGRRASRLARTDRSLGRGVELLAGVDEVGMGPLAGPVVAAAVVLPAGARLVGVDDSKRLTPDERNEAADRIRATALGIGLGSAEVSEIAELNVYHAGLLAMRRAVEALPEAPGHVLVDARTIPGLAAPQTALKSGDGRSLSIAAASILAKTERDGILCELDRRYPGYGFARHKGYSTPEHAAAIRRLGPCPEHRPWAYVEEVRGGCSPLFYELLSALDGAVPAPALRAVEDRLAACRAQLTGDEHHKLRLVLRRRAARQQRPERGG